MTAFSRALTLLLGMFFMFAGARAYFLETTDPVGAEANVDTTALNVDGESPAESEPSPEESDEEEELGEKADMFRGAMLTGDDRSTVHVARDRGTPTAADHARDIFRPPEAA